MRRAERVLGHGPADGAVDALGPPGLFVGVPGVTGPALLGPVGVADRHANHDDGVHDRGQR